MLDRPALEGVRGALAALQTAEFACTPAEKAEACVRPMEHKASRFFDIVTLGGINEWRRARRMGREERPGAGIRYLDGVCYMLPQALFILPVTVPIGLCAMQPSRFSIRSGGAYLEDALARRLQALGRELDQLRSRGDSILDNEATAADFADVEQATEQTLVSLAQQVATRGILRVRHSPTVAKHMAAARTAQAAFAAYVSNHVRDSALPALAQTDVAVLPPLSPTRPDIPSPQDVAAARCLRRTGMPRAMKQAAYAGDVGLARELFCTAWRHDIPFTLKHVQQAYPGNAGFHRATGLRDDSWWTAEPIDGKAVCDLRWRSPRHRSIYGHGASFQNNGWDIYFSLYPYSLLYIDAWALSMTILAAPTEPIGIGPTQSDRAGGVVAVQPVRIVGDANGKMFDLQHDLLRRPEGRNRLAAPVVRNSGLKLSDLATHGLLSGQRTPLFVGKSPLLLRIRFRIEGVQAPLEPIVCCEGLHGATDGEAGESHAGYVDHSEGAV